MRTLLLSSLTVLLPSLSTSLLAQRTEEGSVVEAAPDEPGRRGDPRGKVEKNERGQKGDGVEEENLTPEQRLARNIISGASAHLRFQAALKPAKLLPGQSGTLLVTAILQGEAVLPAPPPLEVLSSPQQGVVTLGGLMVRPAENGRLAKGYLGRPVYDNYAVFELPVTLAADAQVGKRYPLVVDMKFDLYDGTSAQPIGRFLDRVATEVEAGVVADPEVLGVRANRPEAVAADKVPETAPSAPVQPASVQPGSDLGGGTTLVAAEAPVPVPAAPTPQPTPSLQVDDGGGGPVLLAVGGGIVLVLLVLLLARRK